MEDNTVMPSAFALETQPIGETGGEDIFRDDNDIMQGQKRSTLSFLSQSDTHSRAVWLMYLMIV